MQAPQKVQSKAKPSKAKDAEEGSSSISKPVFPSARHRPSLRSVLSKKPAAPAVVEDTSEDEKPIPPKPKAPVKNTRKVEPEEDELEQLEHDQEVSFLLDLAFRLMITIRRKPRRVVLLMFLLMEEIVCTKTDIVILMSLQVTPCSQC